MIIKYLYQIFTLYTHVFGPWLFGASDRLVSSTDVPILNSIERRL